MGSTSNTGQIGMGSTSNTGQLGMGSTSQYRLAWYG